MNKLILTTTALLLAGVAQAAILKVGGVNAYATPLDAYTAAQNGDTIMLHAGTTGTISTYQKRLVWIGPGYFTSGVDGNANQQVQGPTGTLTITFNGSGASGSKFYGINGLNMGSSGSNLSFSDILIDGCNNVNVQASLANGGRTLSNWTISRSFGVSLFSGMGTVTNCTVNNFHVLNTAVSSVSSNFTGAESSASGVVFDYCTFTSSSLSFFTIPVTAINSLFLGSVTAPTVTNTSFVNCCISSVSGFITGNNNTYYHSGNANTAGINGTGNTLSANSNFMSTNFFVGYPTQGSHSNDGRYMLTPGSIGNTHSVSGGEIGIFGGSNPYKLSGTPPTPVFYMLNTAPTATSSPHVVEFSVKGNN